MINSERIQALIHKVEVEMGSRWLYGMVFGWLLLALALWYDTHCFHSFDSPQAMDAAQVARNLAEGRGFTTDCIRPFSIYLLQKHGHAPVVAGTALADLGRLYGPHPDLANPPVYPAVLAGLFKATSPKWKLELNKPFWGGGGHFARYRPEFMIAIFNQLLLLAAAIVTFRLARTLFDGTVAWLSALLMLGSDLLWKFSVSGLPMLLLLLIFLGLSWCLVSFEEVSAPEKPDERQGFRRAILAGLLTGVGMLTQYSFGWVIVPVLIYFVVFGGPRRIGLALSAGLVFVVTVSPWILRNLIVSGTVLGTAGYAVTENTFIFPGSRLMQSLNPDLSGVFGLWPYLTKLGVALPALLRSAVPGVGGGWVGCLFLAGLLLGLRRPGARRLRYFAVSCLGLFLLVNALGQTALGTGATETNPQNLLVLLTPLAIIFGMAFFLTLLDQMDLPWPPLRFAVMGLVVALGCLQLFLTLLPPKEELVSFPPYSPPEIQRFSQWLQPNELVMSDIPWAVAWYGDRQCVWTTLDSGAEFYQLNDYLKPVSGLYWSEQTMDGRLLSECLHGSRDNWCRFALEHIGVRNDNGEQTANAWDFFFRKGSGGSQKNFPLQFTPPHGLTSGLFLADRPRW
jgi:hypothetical protein